MNNLEEIFLEVIDFEINVDQSDYNFYNSGLDVFFCSELSPDTKLIIDQSHQAFAKAKAIQSEIEKEQMNALK